MENQIIKYVENEIYDGYEINVEKSEGDDSVKFIEMKWNEEKGQKVPVKVLDWSLVKWLAENGRIKADDVKDYMKVNVKSEMENNPTPKKKKVKKVENDLTGKNFEYKGKSKKIQKGTVEVLNDYGTICKVKDGDGNVTKVSKSTLK